MDLSKTQKFIVVALLFLSGLCALIYQVGWLRELRLIFGGSTVATAVVLAIFMGGLGFGGLFWGKIADRYHNPFRLYAYFEIGIALLAAVSPFMLSFATNYFAVITPQASSSNVLFAGSGYLPSEDIYKQGAIITILNTLIFLLATPWILWASSL